MKPNVGPTDRILRIVAGVAILSLIFLVDGNARWWGLIGLAPIATALFRYCPPYAWLGINTCSSDRETAEK